MSMMDQREVAIIVKLNLFMKQQAEGSFGLLYVGIKEVRSLSQKKFGHSKLQVKVGDQGYTNMCDLSRGGTELNQTKMFQCRKDDNLQLSFSDDKNGYEGELRFPLKKLIQMPRVKHVIEAILMKKVDKQKRSDPNLKIENLLQVELQVIYLNNIQGKFKIITIQADLSRDTQMFGNMDPYIVLKLGAKTHTTKAKMNEGKHCIWTEPIELQVTDSCKSVLNIRIKDKDPLSDDLICLGQILLLKEGLLIPSQKPKQRQFSLFYQNKVAGIIKLEYSFEILPFNY